MNKKQYKFVKNLQRQYPVKEYEDYDSFVKDYEILKDNLRYVNNLASDFLHLHISYFVLRNSDMFERYNRECL